MFSYICFLQVNAERPVLNGPDGDKLQEETKVISKPEPEDEVDDIPSHPPPQPPSQPPIPPKEPLPEEEDIPVKAVEIKDNVVEDDDSDHYYDKVPDQFDVKDDKNNENEDDDLYEIPTSSKLPDKLPDGCRFVVSNVTLLLILVLGCRVRLFVCWGYQYCLFLRYGAVVVIVW
jgi:hypothetical protein